MKVSISKSSIKGKVKAPSSKSYTLRALMCAALADGESELVHPLSADDTEAAQNVLTKIGVGIGRQADSWLVNGGHFHQPDGDLYCADSAGTLRFMTAICSVVPGKSRLTAGPSLSKRPVKPLIEALKQLGVQCSATGNIAPVIIEGGKFKGGITSLPGNVSSQFVSALLLAAPLAEDSVRINLTPPLESRPYILMTLDCMQKFGVQVESSPDLLKYIVGRQTYTPVKYIIEGDWSSASYFLALGAVAGEVEVENLDPHSRQGDKAMLDLLKSMGADVTIDRDSITVKKSALKAVKADLSDCIDLLPTMAVLAAVADGVSEFTGIARARLKESNRVTAVREGLENMGINVAEGEEKLTVTGSRPQGSLIDSKGDHRIAMAFSILGTVAGDTLIDDAECVSKTFPAYWEELRRLGGAVNGDE
ncbi:MAG: 3-phosphoshikimate 1-carboxyvinyltransferase [Chloroflexi bacterium]|nr:3-phosphoshikimate 1-carboxyvinyltransferase [Chloroflexota bacterium]